MKNETDNATHTPGPWEMRGPCEITGRYSVTRNGPLFYVGDAGEPGDGEANARLAASAPELLEALRDAEFLLRKAGQLAGPMRDSFNRSAADARTAIAKATGGEQ